MRGGLEHVDIHSERRELTRQYAGDFVVIGEASLAVVATNAHEPLRELDERIAVDEASNGVDPRRLCRQDVADANGYEGKHGSQKGGAATRFPSRAATEP